MPQTRHGTHGTAGLGPCDVKGADLAAAPQRAVRLLVRQAGPKALGPPVVRGDDGFRGEARSCSKLHAQEIRIAGAAVAHNASIPLAPTRPSLSLASASSFPMTAGQLVALQGGLGETAQQWLPQLSCTTYRPVHMLTGSRRSNCSSGDSSPSARSSSLR